MKTSRPIAAAASLLLAVLAIGAFLGCAEQGRAQAFQPGEILVDGANGSNIARYSASGSLLQTFSGRGTTWQGASLTPDGNLVSAYYDFSAGVSGIDIFNPDGTQMTTFATFNGFRSDVSVFANGTLALNNQTGNTVQFCSQTGTLLQTVILPGLSNPWGNTVGSDGILYVSGYNNLARVDLSGTFLGLISLGFQPGDLVMNPVDGTLWVSARSTGAVEHIRTDGTVLGSFATGSNSANGIGLAADNNSLYVSSGSMVEHFDLSGNLLGSFDLTPQQFYFLTVIPYASWTGATNANWNTVGNWGGPPVPSMGDKATFNNGGNAHTTVSLGSGVTVETIIFATASAAAYTIGSGGVNSQALTLQNGGLITVSGDVISNQRFNATLVLGTDATTHSYGITNDSTTAALTLAGDIIGGTTGTPGTKTLTVSGTGNTELDGAISRGGATALTLTKSGTGTLTLTGAQAYDTLTASDGITNVNGSFTNGTATMNANATVNFGASQTLAALNIGDGVKVTFGDGLPFAADDGKPPLSSAPEPGSAALLLSGLAFLAGCRRSSVCRGV